MINCITNIYIINPDHSTRKEKYPFDKKIYVFKVNNKKWGLIHISLITNFKLFQSLRNLNFYSDYGINFRSNLQFNCQI